MRFLPQKSKSPDGPYSKSGEYYALVIGPQPALVPGHAGCNSIVPRRRRERRSRTSRQQIVDLSLRKTSRGNTKGARVLKFRGHGQR